MNENHLGAQVEAATSYATGVVSTAVICPVKQQLLVDEHYDFCLREINCTEGGGVLLGYEEAYGIMGGATVGQPGLALMPLYSFAKTHCKDAKDCGKTAVEKLRAIGLPLSVTLWLDMHSVNACDSKTSDDFVKVFAKELTQAGYSVGHYFGNTTDDGCIDESNLSGIVNTSVLKMVDCGSDGNIKYLSIGDNDTACCEIRWAYYA